MMRAVFVITILSFLAAISWTSCNEPSPLQMDQGTGNLNIQVIVTNLDTPWALDFSPDGRIFVTERSGRVRVIKDGQLLAEPWISLNVAAARGWESGLMGLALDPQFASNQFIYVAYTYRDADTTLHNRLVRLREDSSTGRGVVERVLVDGVPGAPIHDGGRVKFGPDGKLYWTIGETGTSRYAQDLSSFNGKILRLNPDGTVPGDNPFPGSMVYSYGHRNPEGLAWQPGTGRLYETEHGPSGELKGVGQDEVNFIQPGKNYGWPVIAGSETREGMIPPIIQSGLSETWAPGGASFIQGGPWSGAFLFAGLRGQALYHLTLDPNNPSKVVALNRLLTGQYGRLRDVVQGPDGAIYILTSNRDGRGSPASDDDKLLKLLIR